MDEVAQNVPTLEKIVSEIEGLAESGGKYVEAPHVIEVTLPMLCRYRPQLSLPIIYCANRIFVCPMQCTALDRI